MQKLSLIIIPTLLLTLSCSTIFVPDKKLYEQIALLESYILPQQAATIDINSALNKSLKNHFLIQQALYELKMSNSSKEAFLTQYSPYLSLNSAYGEAHNISNPLGDLSGKNTNEFDWQLALGKKFESGTNVTLVLGDTAKTAEVDTTILGVGGGPATVFSHNTSLVLSIQQQLLKNAFGQNDKLTEEILLLQQSSQESMTKHQISLIAAGVISDYWKASVAYRYLCDAKIEFLVYTMVRDKLKENLSLGLIEPYVLNQFNALVHMTNIKVSQAEFNYEQSLKTLRKAMNLETTQLRTLPLYEPPQQIPSKEALLEKALLNRADYLQAANNLSIAQKNITMQKNLSLPELALNYQHVAFNSNPNWGDSFADTLSSKYNNWKLSASMLFLFDNKANEIAVRDAEYRFEQAKLAEAKVRTDIHFEIEQAVDQYELAVESYATIQTAGQDIEAYINGLLKRLSQGKTSSTVLKDAVDLLVQYRSAHTQTLNSINLALMNLDLITNSFFTAHNINLNDYLSSPNNQRSQK